MTSAGDKEEFKGVAADKCGRAIGAATLATTLKALAKGGTAVSHGSASGPPPAIEPRQLVPKCTRLAGAALFTYVADPSQLQRCAAV